MNWEEKFAAIKSLSSATLEMRSPGDWYVSHIGIEIKKGNLLEGRYGNGETPEKAVLDHWEKLTNLNSGERIVLNAYKDDRVEYVWDSYMWKPCKF